MTTHSSPLSKILWNAKKRIAAIISKTNEFSLFSSHRFVRSFVRSLAVFLCLSIDTSRAHKQAISLRSDVLRQLFRRYVKQTRKKIYINWNEIVSLSCHCMGRDAISFSFVRASHGVNLRFSSIVFSLLFSVFLFSRIDFFSALLSFVFYFYSQFVALITN